MAWTSGVWLVGAALAALATYFAVQFAAASIRLRTTELKRARDALEIYERNLDTLLDDPATPDTVRDLLLRFDRGIGNRSAAHYLATSVFRKDPMWFENSEPSPAIVDARALRSHRPDLYQAWINTVQYGFEALMLRWFLPAIAFRMIWVNPGRDPETPTQAVVCATDVKHHHPCPLPAAA